MLRLVAVALFAMTGYAHAGCANFTDGSLSAPPPLVELCFGDDCETTRQEWICSTSEWVSTEFSNGIVLEVSAGPDNEPRLLGKDEGGPIAADRLDTLRCRALDDNLDACSPL